MYIYLEAVDDPSFGWKFGLVLRGPDLQKMMRSLGFQVIWIDTIEIALFHTNLKGTLRS